MASGQGSKGGMEEKVPWGPQVGSHICDSTPVPGHCLRFQRCLLHPLSKGLKLILGVQDKEAGVLGGSLEERYVWAQPPVERKEDRVLLLRVEVWGIPAAPHCGVHQYPKGIFYVFLKNILFLKSKTRIIYIYPHTNIPIFLRYL